MPTNKDNHDLKKTKNSASVIVSSLPSLRAERSNPEGNALNHWIALLCSQRRTSSETMTEAKFSNQKYTLHLRSLNRLLTDQPRNALALCARGNVKLMLGKLDEALIDLDASLVIKPNNASALTIRGDVKNRLGKLNEALVDLDASLTIAPNDAFSLTTRGDVKRQLGKLDDALVDLDASLTITPNDAFALAIRGDIKRLLGKFGEALVDLDASLAIEPNDAFALAIRGDIKCQLGTFDKAQAQVDLDASLAIEPNNAFALAIRGNVKRLLGKFGEALVDLDGSLAIEPNNASALAIRGKVKWKLGKLREALVDLDASLAIEPNNASVLTIRGEVKRLLSNLKGDLVDCNASLAKNLRRRGIIKYKLGNFIGALDDVNASLEINSDNKYALSCRAAIKQRCGDFEGFESAFKAVLSDNIQTKITIFPSDEISDINQAPLGHGTFGTVYKATWHKKTVAVKEISSDPEQMSSILTEVECQARLDHPNIVSLYGVSYTSMKVFLVMELMVKGSLAGLLKSDQDLPWKIRLSISIGVVKGLLNMHQKGIIHGDIKSDNILLDPEFNPKISDFGFAHPEETPEFLSKIDTVPFWYAPELLVSHINFTKASDVYAIGILLLEIARKNTKHYTAYNTDADIRAAVCNGVREEIPSTTPPSFATLIGQCWAQRADQRPAMEKVLDDLHQYDQTPTDAHNAFAR